MKSGDRHFCASENETPTYSQKKYPGSLTNKIKARKYSPAHPKTNRVSNATSNFNAWKEFIARNGYKPRPRIAVASTGSATNRMTEAERLEEIRLGKWADNVMLSIKGIRRTFKSWEYPEQQAEFNKLWDETPTYFKRKDKK